jgi:hypothetical protein
MKLISKGLAYLCLILLGASGALAQNPASTEKDWFKVAFASTISNIKNSLARKDASSAVDAKDAIADDLLSYTVYLESGVVKAELMQQLEVNRQDKQPGATSNSSGSTSLVSKGSSPSLLGFALEHGGLTQTTSGNTITFRGNVVNSITALLKSTYQDSYELSQKDPVVRYLSKVSFGISFDTKANQPSTAQGFEPSSKNFSGFSTKYDLVNHRDPRDHSHWKQWNQLTRSQGVQTSNAVVRLTVLLQQEQLKFAKWRDDARASIDSLPPDPTEDQIAETVQKAADSFKQAFGTDPDVKAALLRAAQGFNSYLTARKQVLDNAHNSLVATVEYNFSRQLTSNDKNITATQPNQKIPDLSNVNLVLERGFKSVDLPELTFNAGGTWFNSPNTANPKQGRVRDIRASLEADWQLIALAKLNKPTVSLAGQYLNLIAEPLGQQVMLNGVTIVRRGPMEVFQAKLTIPAGGSSGVKIPLSFTWASRTELVKESDVRGNIGITFDLDTLFSTKTK